MNTVRKSNFSLEPHINSEFFFQQKTENKIRKLRKLFFYWKKNVYLFRSFFEYYWILSVFLTLQIIIVSKNSSSVLELSWIPQWSSVKNEAHNNNNNHKMEIHNHDHGSIQHTSDWIWCCVLVFGFDDNLYEILESDASNMHMWFYIFG